MKRQPFDFAHAVGIAATAQTSYFLADPARILVALSGGPDSTSLLLALYQALPDALVGAAHFHHGLRGADANEDASFCARICARLGVPLAVCLGKVTPAGRSPQAAARTDRYEFLAETANEWGANCLAVAHTADDQAETVLGRVLRGTSVDGLAGIPPTRELSDGLHIIRPLLDLTRAQVETFCADNGIVPRQDPSNRGTKYVRSRLRQRMPEIAREFNPRLVDALRRLADNARTDSEYIAVQSKELWARAVTAHEPGETISLSVAVLVAAHPALTRRVLLAAIRTVYPVAKAVEREEATTAAFVEALEQITRAGTGAANLPGNVHAKLTHKRTLLVLQYPANPEQRAGD
ncbi:MAG: tRNA lysidine(34) synthetase TilS [Akkermansiaceae bacterium]|nr:tRNA lysidine(34) synthetase TilS [Armatimonadota bacterium]